MSVRVCVSSLNHIYRIYRTHRTMHCNVDHHAVRSFETIGRLSLNPHYSPIHDHIEYEHT